MIYSLKALGMKALGKTILIAMVFSTILLTSIVGYAISIHNETSDLRAKIASKSDIKYLMIMFSKNRTLKSMFVNFVKKNKIKSIIIKDINNIYNLSSIYRLIFLIDSNTAHELDCNVIQYILSRNNTILVIGREPLASLLDHCPNLNLTLRILSEGGAPDAAVAISAIPLKNGLLMPYYRFYGIMNLNKILNNEIKILKNNNFSSYILEFFKDRTQALDEGLPWDESMLTWYYVGIVTGYNYPIVCSIGNGYFTAGYMDLRAFFASAWLNDVSYNIPYEFKIGIEESIKHATTGFFGLPTLPITSPVTIGEPEKIDLVLHRDDECIADMYPYEETNGPLHVVLHYLEVTAKAIRERTFPLDTDGGINIIPEEYMSPSETYRGLRNSRGIFKWGQVLPLFIWSFKSDGRAGVAYYVESRDPLEAMLNITGSMITIDKDFRKFWPPFSVHSCIVYKWYKVKAYYMGPLIIEREGKGNKP